MNSPSAESANAPPLEEPQWLPGTPYPTECAIWVWATYLIDYAKRGQHEEWLALLRKHHPPAVIEQVKDLARKRWR